ncbi:MAG: sulfatase-like hydrolase/transferase [Selenomonadaceae bacterium]|nr:sulfatase-like hydrolase/transferase [Selenomonadaceae bacterium]
MRYPEGDPKGRDLFRALEQRAEEKAYDDEFLLFLIEYQRMYPESEHFDIFYARYAAFHGNYRVALEHAEKARRKRMVNFEVWKLLMECYTALGKMEKAMLFQGYCCNFYGRAVKAVMHKGMLQECLDQLTLSMNRGNYAPFCEKRMYFEEMSLHERNGVWGGEYLPLPQDENGYSYWVGVYNELSVRGGRGMLLEDAKKQEHFFQAAGGDFVFDIMRSKSMKEWIVKPGKEPVILPIAATEQAQSVRFRAEGLEEEARLGQWEYSFFRMDKETTVSSASEAPLVFGRPVPLGHSKRRRRMVLHILLDALNWNMLKEQASLYMPHTMEFFSQGVIFRQHFSVGEYTYPSLPTIETGMYPHHSQIFNERAAVQLAPEYITLSERMRDLGYYCAYVMGGGHGIYNETTRGYDRLLVNSYDLPAYIGVDRVIRHLDGLSECDQFLLLHVLEAHPWSIKKFPVCFETQVKVPLQDALSNEREGLASVYLPNTPIYQEANRQAMRRIDRNLKFLFDFIRERYDEEEYIVQLYSDHGNPIYDDAPGILSDGQTGAAYMARGAGVPKRGMVEELTSAVDIYPVLGKLAGFPVGEWVDGNLPAVFGGTERDHVISYSLFPGHPYELCIRTKEHEFYLESREPVNEDGTVDLSGAELSVHARDEARQPVEDSAVMGRFLELAREYTKSFNHEGRQWRSLVESRPEWYCKEKKF